jgi:uncharacterized GH25 family protein
LFLAVNAHAHFAWIELPPDAPGVVQLRFEEAPGERTRESLQELVKGMQAETNTGTTLSFTVGDGALESERPDGATRAWGSYDYGVLDRSEQGRGVFMLVYHAKAVAEASEAGEKVGLPLEVTAELDGQNLTCTVLYKGEPAADTEVFLSLPGVVEETEMKTDASGQVRALVMEDGWVGARATAPEEGAGEIDGEKYELTRHYSTLTFPVGETASE